MSRKPVTNEMYQNLLDAFRRNGEHPAVVAKIAKVNQRTARKAWDFGFPKKGLDPIRDVIAKEQVKARAAIIAQQSARKAALQAERDKASQQAARSRAQEGQIVELVRGATLQSLTISVSLLSVTRAYGDKVKARIAELVALPDGHPKQLTAQKGIDLIRQVVSLQNLINSGARDAFDLERIHLGQPTQKPEGVLQNVTEMTMDEAQARIDMALHALENAKRVGGLTVLDGGLAKPRIGKPVTPDSFKPPATNGASQLSQSSPRSTTGHS